MNILMITSEFPPVVGGVASHVFELSKELVKQGDSVTVLTRFVKGSNYKETVSNIKINRVTLFGNRHLYEFFLARQIKALVKKESFDLIHVHGMRPLNAVKDINLPVIFTNHTSGFLKRLISEKTRNRANKRISHCDVILAPSKELIEATKQVGYTGKTVYIPNGVDENIFSPGASDLRQKKNIPEEAFVVLLARRLAKKNGVLYFAEAIKKIKNKNSIFVVAGDGEEREVFESIVDEEIKNDKVIMLGSVPNEEMPNVFRAANLSVLPSLMEATSIAGLEAMSSGVALLGTKVGGIPEIIEEDVNGFLVEPRNSKEMAKLIDIYSEHPEISERHGLQGREKVLETFSWNKIAKETRKSYSSKQDKLSFLIK